MTVRYDNAVVVLKQKLGIELNGRPIYKLPVTYGNIRIKQVSSTHVMGKWIFLTILAYQINADFNPLVELLDLSIYLKWNGVYNLEIDIPDIFTETRVFFFNM